jgi:hypothetical protein
MRWWKSSSAFISAADNGMYYHMVSIAIGGVIGRTAREKARHSGARNGLELLSFSAIPRNEPAIRFGENANLINAKSAICKSGGIAGREEKVAG